MVPIHRATVPHVAARLVRDRVGRAAVDRPPVRRERIICVGAGVVGRDFSEIVGQPGVGVERLQHRVVPLAEVRWEVGQVQLFLTGVGDEPGELIRLQVQLLQQLLELGFPLHAGLHVARVLHRHRVGHLSKRVDTLEVHPDAPRAERGITEEVVLQLETDDDRLAVLVRVGGLDVLAVEQHVHRDLPTAALDTSLAEHVVGEASVTDHLGQRGEEVPRVDDLVVVGRDVVQRLVRVVRVRAGRVDESVVLAGLVPLARDGVLPSSRRARRRRERVGDGVEARVREVGHTRRVGAGSLGRPPEHRGAVTPHVCRHFATVEPCETCERVRPVTVHGLTLLACCHSSQTLSGREGSPPRVVCSEPPLTTAD